MGVHPPDGSGDPGIEVCLRVGLYVRHDECGAGSLTAAHLVGGKQSNKDALHGGQECVVVPRGSGTGCAVYECEWLWGICYRIYIRGESEGGTSSDRETRPDESTSVK